MEKKLRRRGERGEEYMVEQKEWMVAW